MWLCRCECGREPLVPTSSLRRGLTRSCGCLQVERRRDHPRFDITGTRSGKLVAVAWTGTQDRAGSRLWKCQCDCGGAKTVSSYQIKKGVTISCGCAQQHPSGLLPAEHRSRHREYQNVRRARKLQCEGSYTEDEVSALLERQKHRCAICFKRLKNGKFHRDHNMPLSRGGSNFISNIQLTCPKCNLRKNGKDPFHYALERGLLV